MSSIPKLGFFKIPKTCPNFSTRLISSQFSTLMASSKIIAEYAKSSRSSCKKCSKTIQADTLRLGLTTKEGGYTITKWHHLNCFPKTTPSFKSVEKFSGFSSLKPTDQETLKNLVNQAETEETESSEREGKKRKVSDTETESSEKREMEMEIVLNDSDVKNEYKEVALSPEWKAFETVIFLDDGVKASGKIAAFDFDGCLARTSVKKVGAEAWSLMYDSIPEKLKKVYGDGYKVVIFTNEANIERWKNKRKVAIDSKVGRLESFIEKVEVPVQVFISCGHGDDRYRKPNVGMWRLMEKYFNAGVKIDMDESFYVGDAAGRDGDHSNADSQFANTIGLKFYVPEDYFEA